MAADPANEQWKPRVNPWVIASTVALAAFMEVLDTSIANVALPHIAGNLGASTDEGTWVLTSTFPLAEAKQAHERVALGHIQGKIALTVL